MKEIGETLLLLLLGFTLLSPMIVAVVLYGLGDLAVERFIRYEPCDICHLAHRPFRNPPVCKRCLESGKESR